MELVRLKNISIALSGKYKARLLQLLSKATNLDPETIFRDKTSGLAEWLGKWSKIWAKRKKACRCYALASSQWSE